MDRQMQWLVDHTIDTIIDNDMEARKQAGDNVSQATLDKADKDPNSEYKQFLHSELLTKMHKDGSLQEMRAEYNEKTKLITAARYIRTAEFRAGLKQKLKPKEKCKHENKVKLAYYPAPMYMDCQYWYGCPDCGEEWFKKIP